MRVQRNYNQPFFSNRRRGSNVRVILLLGAMIGGLLLLVVSQFNQLQSMALDQIGLAPTTTPFASDLATRALQAFTEGDLDTAIVLFEQALEQQPENVNYLYEYGNILIEADRDDEAVAIGDFAIQVEPNDPRGYALKARALMWTQQQDAITAAIQGIEVDPNFGMLYAAQGVAYTVLLRLDEGVRNAERAAQLEPMNPLVQRALYTPYLYVGRYQDAINALNTAISLQPNLAAPMFELAFIYSLPQVGEPELAIAIYNTILVMEPENAKANLRLCETYARVDDADFRVAQPYCDRALEIDPDYGSAYRETGRMQYARRNYEGAIDSFEECRDLGADDIECWYLAGLSHYWLDECDDAWEILLESQELAVAQQQPQQITDTIEDGLFFITENCVGYTDQTRPTVPPPTPLPPTPIGGGFG